MTEDGAVGAADILRAGNGPAVILIHASVSSARQWRRLSDRLADRFTVLAANMIGYGATPTWPGRRKQTLDDQAASIERAIGDVDGPIAIVGHSFGGSVAMKLAARLGSRVTRLGLIEPNPVNLLRDEGRDDAFAEAHALFEFLRATTSKGDWTTAAERFSEYWAGAGSWAETPPERRDMFVDGLRPNPFEWGRRAGRENDARRMGRAAAARDDAVRLRRAAAADRRDRGSFARRAFPLAARRHTPRRPYGAGYAARRRQPVGRDDARAMTMRAP